MDAFNDGLRSINEWCFAHDEVDLGLTWDVIKYLHWETKWLTDSMTILKLKSSVRYTNWYKDAISFYSLL